MSAAEQSKQAHTPGPWALTTVPTVVGSCHKIGPFPSGRSSERDAGLKPTYESASAAIAKALGSAA